MKAVMTDTNGGYIEYELPETESHFVNIPSPCAPPQQPHRCPVCIGKGMVDAGFYTGYGMTASASPEQCRACNGKGVIWG